MKETTKSIIYGVSPIALYAIQTSSTEYIQKFQTAMTILTQNQQYSTSVTLSVITNILSAICIILLFVMVSNNNVTKIISGVYVFLGLFLIFDQYSSIIMNHLYTNVITQFTYNNISLIVITTVIMAYNLVKK